jgi:BirA family biotin operon repressor/biotin-[acetyl-CoA-carboxylase] ligase
VTYDGADPEALRRLLDVPRFSCHAEVESTMDVAHALAAEGAPAGTLVLADRQTAARGRGGRRWTSASGAGVWLTLVERPLDPDAVDVLSLRVGLKLAAALDRFSVTPVRLKWPNDLFVDAGKLAGILVEARWRDARPDWVALGVGINVLPPEGVPVAGSLGGASRVEVLAEAVPALRAAASARGHLTARELEAFAARDMARGRDAREPGRGRVAGITAAGDLLLDTAAGRVAYRTGSLVLEDATS